MTDLQRTEETARMDAKIVVSLETGEDFKDWFHPLARNWPIKGPLRRQNARNLLFSRGIALFG